MTELLCLPCWRLPVSQSLGAHQHHDNLAYGGNHQKQTYLIILELLYKLEIKCFSCMLIMQIYSQKYLVHSSFAHNRAKINHKSNNIKEKVAYPKKLVFLRKCQN